MDRLKNPLLVFALLAVAIGAGTLLVTRLVVPEVRALRSSQDALAQQVEELRHVVQLMRFEQKPGAALTSVLSHLQYWCEQLERAGGSRIEIPVIEKRLDEGYQALLALGPSVFGELMAAFQEATSESHDDYRKSLLQAMCQLDPKRGADLANACLERREIHVSPRMRLLAADELLKVDARRAGDTLKEIMVTEYYRGIATNRIPPGQEKIYRNLPGGLAPHENPGFFNLVSDRCAPARSATACHPSPSRTGPSPDR
jgi:hypothetical protein